jgi:dephospho-CoA kinase
MITIGITGIIGSGKTTASNILKRKGFTVIDLDRLAKKAIALKEVQEDIITHLGKKYVKDGIPVIEKLRDAVFVDRDTLQKLESIIHPRVGEELWKEIGELREAGTEAAIVDGPLLYETGLYKKLDKTVVVSTKMGKIKERLRARGMSEKDMERRMALQIPLEKKEEMTDFVIFNNGTKKDLEKEVEMLLRRIKEWEVMADAP